MSGSFISTKAMVFTAIGILLFTIAIRVQCNTYDDDKKLEFYWSAASGNVHHYNVYLSIDEDAYSLVGETATAPTQAAPYAVPIEAQDGKRYRLKVEAEDSSGAKGPMSEPSDLVWCKLRSPGDSNGQTAGDTDGDKRVGNKDLEILRAAWNTRRGSVTFDYRADFNYDDFINLLDLIIISSNWGKLYID